MFRNYKFNILLWTEEMRREGKKLRIRIPTPKQVGQAFRSIKDYTRKLKHKNRQDYDD